MRSVSPQQWLDRPKVPLSEQPQIWKARIAIDQESWEETNQLLVVCHDNHA
jgi:hypothetical protein